MNKYFKILNIILFLTGIYISILLFFPIKNVFLYIDSKIYKKTKILIVTNNIRTKLNELKTKNNIIYYKNNDVGKISKIKFISYLFFNRIKLNKITLINNVNIKNINIEYSIINPFIIQIDIGYNNIFNNGKIYINLLNKNVKIYIYKIKNMEIFNFINLKKIHNGEYYYEFNY